MDLKSQVVKEYLSKFPDAKTRPLANLIYKENKELFKEPEYIRNQIRYYRGNQGKQRLKHLSTKEFVKPNRDGTETFKRLPKGLTTLENWKVEKIFGDHKVFIFSDTHIPFHDREALELAVYHAKKFEPDIILINGDHLDHYAISRWETDPRKRNFAEEIRIAKLSFEWLRELFPKARIIYKIGNHEERFDNYMEVKAPELLGINLFRFDNIFELDKYGIELVGDKKPIKFNELFIIHGHEYKSSFFNPVNPARGLYLRSKGNALCSHYHQSSSHSENDLDDKFTSTWSIGHLSDPHPKYMPLNKWNHGFALLETSGNKYFQVQNYKIIDNKIYRA